jgi:hypothetical protein
MATKAAIYFSDLWVSASSNRLSHTRVWNNIACATATIIVLHKEFLVGGVGIEFFQWYLGLVGFQALASKFLALKLGMSSDTLGDTTTTTTASVADTTTTSDTTVVATKGKPKKD